MARIGFYGGCFNPPTKAHIELAEKALKECNLDKIVFVPVGDFYQKDGIIPGIHRYNMLQIACENNEKLQVSDIEIKENKDYKAIDIFEILKEQNKEGESFFLMGADNLKKMPKWKESEKLIRKFNYIILDRAPINAEKIIEEEKLLNENKKSFMIINNDQYNNCSSTNVREIIRRGEQPQNIHNEVYKYIRRNNIY